MKPLQMFRDKLRSTGTTWGLTALLMALAPLSAIAVETKVIRDDSFAQFNQGESTGTELLAQGRLLIGPRAVRLDKTDEGVAWNIAVDPVDGSVFYATGHNGKVYKHRPGKEPELWADLTEPEAISVAIDPTGALLIGASPGGKIYRVVQPGKPQLFFETKEEYVWDMVFDAKGLLYAATGPNGKVYRIRGERNGEVYYDSDATNIMALDFNNSGELVAASQGKAFVIRISGPQKGYVLYASQEDEARTLKADKSGNLYVGINSARTSSLVDRKSSSSDDGPRSALNTPSATPTPSPSPKPGQAKDDDDDATPTNWSSFGSSLGGQSMVVQIQPSGFVTNFWAAPEGPIHSMLVDDQTSSLLVSAGKRGKIYRVDLQQATHSVVADVDEPMVLALAKLKNSTYFATANKAALYELATSGALQQALYASRPFNAGSTVKWGNLYYEAEETSGSIISFETRSGNTSDPTDGTWSEWSRAERVADRIMHVTSPIAQYLQYRLTMQAPLGEDSPKLDNIQAFYVQQNASPILRNIQVVKVGGGAPPAGSSSFAAMAAQLGARVALPAPSPAPGAPPTGPDAPPGAPRPPSPSGPSSPFGPPPSVTAGRGEDVDLRPSGSGFAVNQNTQRLAITWEANDPNGDKLRFKLFFKGEDEIEWKLIEENLLVPRFLFSTEAIPDGKYRIKVEATDAPENQVTSASMVSSISRIYVVDNTPPEIPKLEGRRIGDEFEITASAKDATSILAAAEYNLNASREWQAVAPEDGIFDFYQETFRVRVKPEKEHADSPEHTFSLRVYDREGNSKVEKVLLR